MDGKGKIEDDGIAILLQLYENPGSTTSQIAKNVFEIGNENDLRNKDRKVRYYLEKKYNHLINRKKKNGKKVYELKDDSVFFGLGIIDVGTYDGDEITIGLGDVIIYKDKENRPTVVSIEFEEE